MRRDVDSVRDIGKGGNTGRNEVAPDVRRVCYARERRTLYIIGTAATRFAKVHFVLHGATIGRSKLTLHLCSGCSMIAVTWMGKTCNRCQQHNGDKHHGGQASAHGQAIPKNTLLGNLLGRDWSSVQQAFSAFPRCMKCQLPENDIGGGRGFAFSRRKTCLSAYHSHCATPPGATRG